MRRLDGPVPAIEGEPAFRRCGRRTQPGDAASRLAALLAGLDFDGFTAHGEDLSDAGEVEVVVELAGDPDGAPLAAVVLGLRALVREVRRAPGDDLVESEPDVVEPGRRVSRDGETGGARRGRADRRPARAASRASAVTVRPAMSGTVSSRGMTVPISLVRFSPSSASGLMATGFDPGLP